MFAFIYVLYMLKTSTSFVNFMKYVNFTCPDTVTQNVNILVRSSHMEI